MITDETTVLSVLEATAEMILIVDEKGVVDYVNQAVVETFGTHIGELLGKSLLDTPLSNLLSIEELALAKSSLAEALEGNAVPPQSYTLEKDSRTSIHIVNTISTLRNNEGEIVGAVCAFRNIPINDVIQGFQSKTDSEILQNLAFDLASTANMDGALSIVLDAAMQIESVDSGGIYLIHEDTHSIELTCHHGLSEEFIEHVMCFDLDNPQGKLTLAGKPIYSSYDQMVEFTDEVREQEGLSAIGIIPILSEQTVIGAMNIASHQWKSIPEESRRTLEALASHIGPIIKRVKAEEILREREQFYRNLLDSIPDAVVVTNPDLEIEMVNEKTIEVHGIEYPEAVLEMNGLDLIEPDYHEQAMGQAMRTILEGCVNDVEYRLRRIDGSSYPAVISTAVLRDENDEPKHFVAISKDITEQKRVQEAYNVVVDNSMQGLMIAQDGKIVFANEALGDIMGRSTEEITSVSVDSILGMIHPEQLDDTLRIMATWRHYPLGQPLPKIESRMIRLDGTTVWTQMYGVNSEYNGRPALIAAIMNISERKEAERALQQVNQELEKSLDELRNAQEQLMQSERLSILGKLSAGIGHELRNPLGAMKNSVYFLRMILESDKTDVKESLDILDNEIATSEMIIGSLLDFTHPRKPTLKNVKIQEVLGDALSRILLQDEIEIKVTIDPEIPILLLDPIQISRVFMNVVRNGIHSMPEGGLFNITASMSTENDVVIDFEDTGIGIPEENLERLFEPLFTTKAKGIGLGLAISKSFVEAHKGTIEVESQVGKGSKITIKLPMPSLNNSLKNEVDSLNFQ